MDGSMQAQMRDVGGYTGANQLRAAPSAPVSNFSVAAVPGCISDHTARLRSVVHRLYMIADALQGPVPEQGVDPATKPSDPTNALDAFRSVLSGQATALDSLDRQVSRIEMALGVNRG